MTLHEYLQNTSDWETTVWDKDYDIETYFYKENSDLWDKAMNNIAKALTVTKFSKDGVTVNLYDIIEKNIENFKKKDLFIIYSADRIMEDIEPILAGNVSDEWLWDFSEALNS